MKKKLYIHIGTGKTGTSALQNFLYLNSDALAKNSIKYINAYNIENNHHALCINSQIKVNSYDEKFDLISSRLNEVVSEISKSTENIYIVSSENFPGVTKEEIEKLYINKLSDYVDIHVIAYIRRQDEYLESWYAQVVKADIYNKGSIDSLYDNLKNKKLFDYMEMLSKWENYIGEKNIHVRAYEHDQFFKGNIFNDFMKIFDVEDIKYFDIPKKDPNPSLTRNQILLIRGFIDAGLDKFLDPVLKKPFAFKSKGSKYFLSPQKRTKIIEEFETINSMVANKYLHREKLFFDKTPLEKKEVWEDIKQPSIEYILRAFTHLQSKQKMEFQKEIKEIKEEMKNLYSLIGDER